MSNLNALPLLRTKLFPAPYENRPQLPRPALIERLVAAKDHRLVVLHAPAGYGKSTLLGQYRQYLLARGAQVAWLSCDESDSEPRRLMEYLVAAVRVIAPDFGVNVGRLLDGDESWLPEALIDAFVVDLERLPGDIYLMLDDFHRIRHPSMRQVARYLIERLPRNLRLITGMRYKPHQLNTKFSPAWLFSLGAKDLSLSGEETARYLREIKGLPLSNAEVNILQVRTEGWVTALHLAALALAVHPDRRAFLAGLSGTERTIADYLSEDVVARLPEGIQLFLEQTSVLDELNGDLCNALTGRSDGQETLTRLYYGQLFLARCGEQKQWFRYHPVFAEFLQSRLAKRGDSTLLLHAAARWCESHELPERAIRYAVRARDFSFAADLLERQGANLIASNRVYDILTMLKSVPADVIREHPVFQVFYAWQLAFDQRFAEAEALIEEVGSRLLQGRGRPMHFGLMELFAAAQVLKALVLLYQDKLESCLKVARHWLGMAPDNQPVFRASLSCIQAAAYALLGEYGEAGKSIAIARDNLRLASSDYLQAMTSLIESLICKEHGELERGRAVAESARELIERIFGRRSRVGGPLALAYADLLYEQDRHAAILAELPLATTWRDVATPVELISRGKLVMARARFFAGEPEQGLAELDEWLAELQGARFERAFALGMSCKVQFLLWLRRPNEAERICLQLQQYLASLPARYLDTDTALALTEARLSLSERRADRAQACLEECLAKQTAEHQRDRRLRLSLLLSVAYWRKGNSEKAFALFQPTLEEAWSSGYRRMFQDDALWLLPFWEAWQAVEPKRAVAWQGVAEMLREQCRRLSVDYQSLDENQDVSHREREILRFVAAGLSNRDIAHTVHLSEATIKWHLHNLFSKLGVRSRTQAVLKGKSMGLLSEL
ncbi:LuxR C-terminal-related transcriptional regulator [Pseudomonas sp. LS44]|uniref:helix-turn-helix transcriptional regulator n=1 Tax=Pseudomonas sp. LS44 TaxID=1357074 RepID=UPI00215AB9E4|nr:LuxR C-terminal-related transcriptional regulator [Pseudomonas sp. LS44]UVE19374.1 LuxR C-terminal-related transcriptional regulator [Pseudomonas sp. LS44]